MPKYIPKFVSLLLETIFQPLAKICPSHIKNTVIYYVLFCLLFLLQTTLQIEPSGEMHHTNTK